MAISSTNTATIQATANEMTITAPVSVNITTTANALLDETQSVGTVAEAITFGDMSGAPRKLQIKNLDGTNYVEIDSADTFDKFPQKITAGDFIVLAPQTATIYGKANAAAVLIRKTAFEASA